jgi:N-acylglucosamine-6-phosphate 2-epimerase
MTTSAGANGGSDGRTPKALQSIQGRLIVSCQAAPEDPMHDPSVISAIAASVVDAGAGGVRIDTPAHIEAVRRRCATTIIGLYKAGSGDVYITPSFEHGRAVADAGADIVALDATARPRPDGSSAADTIARLHEELGLVVMADVSTVDEGLRAAAWGADAVATTLFGETGDGHGFAAPADGSLEGPELDGLAVLASSLDIPVIAEGRIGAPSHAVAAFERGAWSVVVGKAITSPGWVVRQFVTALEGRAAVRPGNTAER